MNPLSLKQMIDKNKVLPCSVPDCPNLRHRLHKYCISHQTAYIHFGNPRSKAIQKKELSGVLSEVRDLVGRNESTHIGLQNALTWFDRWLKDAAEDKWGVPGKDHIKRLGLYGITAREMLITCGAVWLFSYRCPHLIPDEKSLSYNLAHQLMKMVPLDYATTASGKKRAKLLPKRDRVAIGDYVRKSLGGLYLNMTKTINEREDRERNFYNAMSKSFD